MISRKALFKIEREVTKELAIGNAAFLSFVTQQQLKSQNLEHRVIGCDDLTDDISARSVKGQLPCVLWME